MDAKPIWIFTEAGLADDPRYGAFCVGFRCIDADVKLGIFAIRMFPLEPQIVDHLHGSLVADQAREPSRADLSTCLLRGYGCCAEGRIGGLPEAEVATVS